MFLLSKTHPFGHMHILRKDRTALIYILVDTSVLEGGHYFKWHCFGCNVSLRCLKIISRQAHIWSLNCRVQLTRNSRQAQTPIHWMSLPRTFNNRSSRRNPVEQANKYVDYGYEVSQDYVSVAATIKLRVQEVNRKYVPSLWRDFMTL